MLRILPLFVLAAALCGAAEITFPADAGIIDVKRDCGAVGDGKADDTTALQTAIERALTETGDGNSRYFSNPIIYLPIGTYRVSDRLDTRLSSAKEREWSGGWRCGIVLLGQERTKTIIRLGDAAPGYGDAASPKAVLRTGTENPNTDGGEGNEQAFRHTIQNLTIDVGRGNPGAVGIDLLVNNRGGIDDVTIRSSDPQGAGFCGVDMTRFGPGPGLVTRCTVEGFDYGLRIQHAEVGMAFEHLTMRHQRKAGFWNYSNWVYARKVVSDNAVPAFVVHDDGNQWGNTSSNFTIAEATLGGGAKDAAAIRLALGARCTLLDVTTAGYGTAVANPKGPAGDLAATAKPIAVWTSHPARSLFTPSIAPLRLKPLETPLFDAPAAQWIAPTAFGANGKADHDDSEALQKAIDAGKPVVYLPRGRYRLEKPLILRGAVRKLIGCTALLEWKGPAGQAGLVFADGEAKELVVEHLNYSGGFIHDSKRTIAFRHCDIMDTAKQPYESGAKATGALVLEDVQFHPFIAHAGLAVYARQLNIEGDWVGAPYADIRGGTAWILGYKTENKGLFLRIADGAKVELIGGFLFNNKSYWNDIPACEIIDSQASLTFGVARNWIEQLVRETRKGQTKALTTQGMDMPIDGGVTWVGMYTSGR